MKPRIVRGLIAKDWALFRRNRFYAAMSILGLIVYVVTYFALPSSVNEKLTMGLYAETVPPAFEQLADSSGFDIRVFASEDELRDAVSKGELSLALALPSDIMESWAEGSVPKVKLYSAADTATETRDAVVAMINELSYAQTGQALTADVSYEVLGPDLLGSQITLRDRMRPLFCVFILMMEILSLASLIIQETEQGTIQALLVTPTRIKDLFVSKGILGVGLAFGQAVVLMAIMGGLTHQPIIILTTLLLGSIMVTGLGFLVAACSRDLMTVTAWGIVVLIILCIPAFGVMFPGLASDWTKIIPSFYLTDTVNSVVNYGTGWDGVGINLLILLAISCVIAIAGMLLLRRRYQ